MGIPVDVVLADYNILLGEILFDFSYHEHDEENTYLRNYENEYTALKNKLDSVNPKVNFLSKVLLYQRDLKYSNEIHQTIKEFYNLK